MKVVDDLEHTNAQILIVDNDLSVVRLLTQALESAGYKELRGFTDPLKFCSAFDSVDPDLIVLDIGMPGPDGHNLLDTLCSKRSPDTFLPVLAIGAPDDLEVRRRTIEAGAKDFLAKPIQIPDFILRVYSLLDTRFLERRLRENYRVLMAQMERRTREVGQAHVETLERLAQVAELRDDNTGRHAHRVARLSALLAQELSLPPEEVELIMQSAPLHDIGKVGIGDHVLLKNGGLSAEDREVMENHTLLGAELLKGGRSDLMKMARQIALSHHERWDGRGYPQGLQAEQIPLPARIVAVADAFDALTHERPYKEAWSIPDALAEIEQERGWQFDPRVVDALMHIAEQEPTLLTPPKPSGWPAF